MPQVSYRGVTTHRVYSFGYAFGPTSLSFIPASLADAYGNPITTDEPLNYNGEVVIYVNRDGSQMRGFAGGVPEGATSDLSDPNNVYNSYGVPSAWESS